MQKFVLDQIHLQIFHDHLHHPDFVDFCQKEAGLPIIGLMCIPPVDEEAAMHFALLNTMAQSLNLTKLSMGMSSDYIDAIGFGATSVRVGSAIFGLRDS